MFAATLVAEDLPKVEGDSLAGHHVVLPAAVSGNVAVMVLGFSKASKTPTSAWGKRIETDFASTPDLVSINCPCSKRFRDSFAGWSSPT